MAEQSATITVRENGGRDAEITAQAEFIRIVQEVFGVTIDHLDSSQPSIGTNVFAKKVVPSGFGLRPPKLKGITLMSTVGGVGHRYFAIRADMTMDAAKMRNAAAKITAEGKWGKEAQAKRDAISSANVARVISLRESLGIKTASEIRLDVESEQQMTLRLTFTNLTDEMVMALMYTYRTEVGVEAMQPHIDDFVKVWNPEKGES